MSEEIVAERAGRAGILRLNRPKALNALTLPMVRALAAGLAQFESDPLVAFVLLEGAGERGFCAGGDIRAIHESGKAGTELAAAFWREEYELNARIAECAKPVVVLMHGIVMGGGAGLSIHASHRIVTDGSRFAMPETGIGFVPDVGSTHRLARAPGGLGAFLAFTGTIVGPADAIAADLADRMVPAATLPALRAALLEQEDAAGLSRAIAAHAAEPAPGIAARHGDVIARAFSSPAIEAILEALERDGSDFARETRATILSRSPTSLRDVEALLAAARGSSLRECLVREFHAALGTLRRPDFYEGVRAAVIDKDRAPRWQPALLSEALPVGADAFAASAGVRPPFVREDQP